MHNVKLQAETNAHNGTNVGVTSSSQTIAKPPPNAKRMLAAGWISVKDQFPEYNLPVLVCQAGEEDSIDICRLESKTERKESISHEWWHGKTGYDSWHYDVTHWQRLPTFCKTHC